MAYFTSRTAARDHAKKVGGQVIDLLKKAADFPWTNPNDHRWAVKV